MASNTAPTQGASTPDRKAQEDSLRRVSLRVTRPRVEVLAAVREHPHTETSGVIEHVRHHLPDVSHQAVYDSLRVLTESGLLRCIQPSGTVARYETRVGDNHHHLVCRVCNVIVDVDCAVGEAACLTPSHSHDFVVDEAEVIYWGLCPDCAARSTGGSPDPTEPATPSPAGKGTDTQGLQGAS
ncbi:Fur family transcriptional regulator [Brevibacterium litoralis]|uniref:Fur family transcriptional regulator n=1 Tax=Brevibacterium litoralis TaxID=3138935 RepID=UPI0032EEA4E5